MNVIQQAKEEPALLHLCDSQEIAAALLAAEELYRATNFLTDNDPDDVVCDGGGTAILVGLSGIRHALDAYRKATGDTQ